MFIFDATKQMAINSDSISCMLIKEITDGEYKYGVVAAINIDVRPKSICLYYGKTKQDCINWIANINNKIASHRVIKG